MSQKINDGVIKVLSLSIRDGEYRVNRPGNQSGEYVPVEVLSRIRSEMQATVDAWHAYAPAMEAEKREAMSVQIDKVCEMLGAIDIALESCES